jgi:hypothetical protein
MFGLWNKNMELKNFDFPEIKEVDLVFSTTETDPDLLVEARERGFYNGDTPYNKLFSKLFFNGGKVAFQEGVDKDFKAKAWPYLKSLMASFEPKHEEKEAISALIMSELLVADE